MKVLVATSATQGVRESDYHWCIEGELVWISIACRADQENPDGPCGCGRGFAGMSSHRATTTAMVKELDGFTHDDLVAALHGSLAVQGWPVDNTAELAAMLAEAAQSFPAGAVIERRLDELRARQ
jgi:hypothetical protein